jgi:Swiss Army Knife RNA repair-like protein
MRQGIDLSTGGRRMGALVAAVGFYALLVPGGSAQTLPAPLPAVPVSPPSLPALPVPQPSIPARPELGPVPAPPAAGPPRVPAPAPPAVIAPILSAPDAVVSPGEIVAPTLSNAPAAVDERTAAGLVPGEGGSSMPSPYGEAGARAPDDTRSSEAAAPNGLSARRLQEMSPRERRRFLAHRWETPLSGVSLRRLRTTVLEHWSCAGVLASRHRRALVMRAGLFGRKPATWRAVARRLDVSPARATRLARSGVARLSQAGMCIHAGGAALGTSVYPAGASSAEAADLTKPDRKPEVVRVLTASETGPDVDADVALALLDKGGGGAPGVLRSFLAVLLALLGGVALATRRSYVAPVFLARGLEGSGKPLLFLDVDGVILVRPAHGSLPPGDWHQLGSLDAYVSEQAGELVRALASRYEIVWATGWAKGANTYFRQLLGLEADLPVLGFGPGGTAESSAWKIREINRAAGRRPIAWMDDNVGDRQVRWARARRAPTLLLQTNGDTGISKRDVRRLLSWADGLGPIGRGRLVRGGHAESAVARPHTDEPRHQSPTFR